MLGLAVAGILFLLLAAAGAFQLNRARKEKLRLVRDGALVIKPYLQMGDKPQSSSQESVEVHFATRGKVNVAVEYCIAGQEFIRASDPEARPVAVPGAIPFCRYSAGLTGLTPGAEFDYRVLVNDREVFKARGKARVKDGAPYRFAVYGDLAAGSAGAQKVAAGVHGQKPDVVVFAGDVVYKRGRVSEYLERFFPVYNTEPGQNRNEPAGAPLISSRMIVAAAGNHDLGMMEVGEKCDLELYPDLLAYYLLWSQPLNGPCGRDSATIPPLYGPQAVKDAFLQAAGSRFPRMSNFSFDFGSSHWLVLDANWYMDWSDAYLRAWVERDLAAASSKKRWKFVCFHQPGFTTDVKHSMEQRMRLLCDIFEKHGVDVVFSGHNHTYERNHPLRFAVKPQPDGRPTDYLGRVDGDFKIDRNFDGRTVTKPDGVLYIVTGGGGARLYLSPDRRADHGALPAFNAKLIDDRHSFTVCDVTDDRLVFKQLGADGEELDSFTITK